ncbi:MAG: enoyl-CoA hydratase-related protein [Acidimicrobiia bacterium]
MADLEVTRDGPVAILTMNRPEARNALSAEMVDGLSHTLHALETDDSVRAVVLRGAGEHFMAGGDVKSFMSIGAEMSSGTTPMDARSLILHRIHHLHTVMFAMRRMQKPILAAVRGAAAGAGVSLAAACDLVMAADDAFFVMAYVNIGTSPDGSSTYFLPKALGLKKTMELALLGERHTAEAMAEAGLVNWVVPTGEFEDRVLAMAHRLASGPTHAMGRTKALLYSSYEREFEAQLQAEAEAFASCVETGDFAEGVAAFIQKRRPEFRGA